MSRFHIDNYILSWERNRLSFQSKTIRYLSPLEAADWVLHKQFNGNHLFPMIILYLCSYSCTEWFSFIYPIKLTDCTVIISWYNQQCLWWIWIRCHCLRHKEMKEMQTPGETQNQTLTIVMLCVRLCTTSPDKTKY